MKSEVSSQQSVGNGVGCFAGDGFQIVSNLISDSECNLLASELSILFENQQKSAKNKIGGVRNLLRSSLRVNETATSAKLVSRLEDLVGRNVFPVRAIFFDKTAESNWRVPWHQDLTIAVAEQIETPGFIAWSLKDGTLHVQPPREILAGRLALRLHLDDCRADNGALKIIPGSHLDGRLSAVQITEWTSKQKVLTCAVPKGGGLLMRPLLLHSSSSARNPSHRRVLHIEYATQELPNGLKWFDR
ncbi:MAG: phytanoyl-CoA dioxygenase family protein [Verrucomicrobiia bacterium]